MVEAERERAVKLKELVGKLEEELSQHVTPIPGNLCRRRRLASPAVFLLHDRANHKSVHMAGSAAPWLKNLNARALYAEKHLFWLKCSKKRERESSMKQKMMCGRVLLKKFTN